MLVLSGLLVFDEVKGFLQFSDVMVVGAYLCQQRVCVHGLGRGLDQIADNDAVVICPWGLDQEAAKERLIQAGQLQELDVGGESEGHFDEREKARGYNGG